MHLKVDKGHNNASLSEVRIKHLTVVRGHDNA